jgi:hypothetical protein
LLLGLWGRLLLLLVMFCVPLPCQALSLLLLMSCQAASLLLLMLRAAQLVFRGSLLAAAAA